MRDGKTASCEGWCRFYPLTLAVWNVEWFSRTADESYMKEYLIRAINDEEFDIDLSKWPEVLRPKSYPSKVIRGWGELRLEVLGCEISLSAEPPGTHIVFESGAISPEVADQIVSEIVERAEAFTGQRGKIISLQ